MSFTKTKIYNLALSALLLSRQVSDTETDTITNEVKILNQFWEDALHSTLQELDLDGLSENVTLELLADLTGDMTSLWDYVYKYPTRCSFLRRIKSTVLTDTHTSHISKRTGLYNGQKAIYTNEYQAVAEIIPNDVSLVVLSSPAGLAVAYKLAFLSSPLLVGKGAAKLRQEIYQSYLISLGEAQELDKLENFNYDSPSTRSEFVAARLE